MITRILLTLFISLFVGFSAQAQTRDHLTQQEVDLVKEAQILDKRIDVFIKAAERRMMVINNSAAANAKQLKKDSERWGELPTGSRAELVSDIARIFDEAITNIDDVSARERGFAAPPGGYCFDASVVIGDDDPVLLELPFDLIDELDVPRPSG